MDGEHPSYSENHAISQISKILAVGILRLQQAGKIQSDLAKKSEVPEPAETAPNRLDLSRNTSVHGPHGSTARDNHRDLYR